jgi:large-conductance mechanosensitive channel
MENEVMETMVDDVVENDEECTALVADGESKTDNTPLVIGLAVGAAATLIVQQGYKRVVKPLVNKGKKAWNDHKAKKAAKAKDEAATETEVEAEFEEVVETEE